MKHFIAIGRRWKDDEATVLVIDNADSLDAAENAFLAHLGASRASQRLGEGPGYVYIDAIYRSATPIAKC